MYAAEDDWYSKYEKSDQIAWLFMIRDPVQWLMAMYDNHHESGEMVKGSSVSARTHSLACARQIKEPKPKPKP